MRKKDTRYILFTGLSKATEILKQHWGFEEFRPLQEEIINSVLAGNDSLALLPTGGGKSICFQVPALMNPGICLVVSPLIALMKDQVSNLNARGIKALSITSELRYDQLDALFDRCIYDEEIKFVYMSPERLKTDLARQRIGQMKVNLIAVDEAHCISEWGYDFRPPYLEIAEIRPLIPGVPVLALTASATPDVVKDIQEKLRFKKPNVFRKSFARPNLAYFVHWDEDKLGKIERIATKQKGSGIVYMRSRKGTERIARELIKRGVDADFYHAGLNSATRSEKQERWKSGELQIIVATNAFGMGIDKADVRFVIHCDIPDTLENYYQECGRAGRDEKKAFAVSLLTKKDVDQFKEKMIVAFPEKKFITEVYNHLGSFFQLAVGSGKDEKMEFDPDLFCKQYGLELRAVLLSLKFLEREGYIAVDEQAATQASVQISANHEAIYKLRDKHDQNSKLIDALLRSYPRMFDEASNISEWTLASRLSWPRDLVGQRLKWLHESGFINYDEASQLPHITYVTERLDPRNVRLSDQHYQLRKNVVQNKAEAMLMYVQSTHKCRSRLILEYFGESDARPCGKCDICLK